MQDVSSAFITALGKAGVTWSPECMADWAGDGYGDTDSIDDMTGLAGLYAAQQSMDDGLPDEVSLTVQGGGIPTMRANLAAPNGYTPTQYFSPLRTDSPLYGYERDTAPVKLEQGAVTADGIQRVRLFTGQMTDVTLQNGGASLVAASATRLALSQLVQPPIREKYYPNGPFDFGLTASWPLSYALHSCAVYPSPPAATGCRLWIPVHGGGNPFIPSANPYDSNFTGVLYGQTRTAADSSLTNRPLRHIRGPFIGSVDCEVTSDELRVFLGSPAELAAGSDWMSTTSSSGSIQFWVRGDAASVNTTPGGSGQFTWGVSAKAFLAGFWSLHTGSVELSAGVDINRKVYVRVFDGTNTATFVSTLTLPTDGAWHFVGASWNVAGNSLQCRLDGTTEINTPSPALSTTNLPTSNAGEASTFLGFALPPAEIQFYTGSVPVGTGWINNDVWYTRRAYVYPSSLEMEVVAEAQPREALEYIAAVAKAEAAAIRIDENDLFYYMPRGYFATTALQTNVETISTRTNSKLPNARPDPSRIRNSVRLTYKQTRIDVLADRILAYTTVTAVPPGKSLFRLAFDTPAVRVDARSSFASGVAASSFVHLTANQINGTDPSPPGGSYVTMNDSIDGTGTYSTLNEIQVDTVVWDAFGITLQFDNKTGVTWYLVNNSADFNLDFSFIGVFGVPLRQLDASISEQVTASVTTRGLRALTVRSDLIQSEAAATIVARRIGLESAWPLVVVDAEVFGDPRRQPTDLVTFDDPVETGASGTFRVYSVGHTINGADYTQAVKMRQEYTVGRWGDGVSRWGRSRWKGQEVTVT